VVQIPFVATDFYTGPLARAIGGIDLSWMVGIAVVSPVYYFAARFVQRPLAAPPVTSASGIR
jgi:nucleobase:cation symporter-1, NCS1 family